MITPWFNTPERLSTLDAEAKAWLRTPFCLHAQAKGAGVDCVHLVHALAASTGWPHALTPPDYSCTDTMHSDDSKLHAYLDTAAGIELVGEFPAALELVQAGDLVSFTIGRAAPHLGIVCADHRFVHVMSFHFVSYSSLDDGTWGKRAARLYRLVETA